MAMTEAFSEEDMKQYESSEDVVELGVYTKKDVLEHKLTLVKRMEIAREEYDDPKDDDGLTYWGVYWKVPFSKFKMNLEEFMTWRNGISFYDSVSTPMRIGYCGHLKRIWFASEKFWQGYFDVESVEENSVFICTWHPLENPEKFPRTSFQGYTTKVPDFKGWKQCPDCKGSGQDPDRFDEWLKGKETYCKNCKGQGFVQDVK